MTDLSDVRLSYLGGELTQRTWFGVPPVTAIVWVVLFLLGTFWFFSSGGSMGMFLITAAVVISLGATVFEHGHRPCYLARVMFRAAVALDERSGRNLYIAPGDPRAGTDEDPRWEYPYPLGKVGVLDLAGTDLADWFILLHEPEGRTPYYSVMLAVDGTSAGLQSDLQQSLQGEAFGLFLAGMARKASFVSGVQILHAVLPHDMVPHLEWADIRAADLPKTEEMATVVESYADALDRIEPQSGDHRSYVVLKFPQTPPLMREASALAKARGHTVAAGVGQVIVHKTRAAATLLQQASMGKVNPYDEGRTCAVFRGLLNPSFRLDDTAGVSWENCWPSMHGERHALDIGDGEWFTAVGLIRSHRIEPTALPPQWALPLITGVEPDPGDGTSTAATTIHYLSAEIQFVEAHIAREVIRGNVTTDEGKIIDEKKRGKVTDGSSDVMARSSHQHRQDLIYGSGHHGALISLSMSVTARTRDELNRAKDRLDEAARDSSISDIDWREWDHHDWIFGVLPLAVMSPTRYTK